MLTAEVKASESSKGWVVVIGETETSKPLHRVREAVQLARRTVQRQGGGKVVVRSRGGAIVESQTVPARHGRGFAHV